MARDHLSVPERNCVLRSSIILSANGTFGKYNWKTYTEGKNIAVSIAKAIEGLKLYKILKHEGKDLKTIGIYSKTREEWLLTDIACWMITATSVPLYDTLGEESILWIFEQTELSTVFINGGGIAKMLAMKKKKQLGTLKILISFDDVDPGTVASAKEVDIEILSFKELIKKGEKMTTDLKPCTPGDLLTVCYTSGTTAKCKGVEISHRAFHDNAVACLDSGVLPDYYPGMAYFAYLPLAHVFERILCYIMIYGGLKIGFSQGDVAKIVEDVALYQPHILVGVPRVFNRLYDNVMAGINKISGFKRKLLNKAIEAKKAAYQSKGYITHWFYDAFVLKKLRQILGGRIVIFVSAAAPIDPTIIETMKILFSSKFIQGYGQTETAGAITLTYPDDRLPGSLGPPLMCCSVKVEDVPEMNYRSTDKTDGLLTPRGELCIKGTNVTKGYFKDPERTKEVIDANGWLHTGDIVTLYPTGQLKIIDRKKNLFKLQQGEYIAPEKIENVLVLSRWVMQIFVYGDSMQTYLIGVIVPQKDRVLEWAKEKSIFQITFYRHPGYI